jgi:energy-coupling factor transport system permease protein
MPVGIDLYLKRESWLHRVDPRVKLLFVAASIVLLLIFKNLFFMLTALLLIHVLHWSAKMPRRKFIFIWKTMLPISIMICALWVIFYPTGTPIFEIWVIKITPLGLAQGIVLALRITTMAFVVFAWLYTTDQPAIVRSLVKLRVSYEWGLTLALALRYIPTFQGMYGVISEAQQARGLNISEGKGFQKVRTLMPIFVAMVISALRASDQLAYALEARAFGASGVERTYLHDIHFRPLDWAYTVFILGTTILLLYLNLRLGFGKQPVFMI